MAWLGDGGIGVEVAIVRGAVTEPAPLQGLAMAEKTVGAKERGRGPATLGVTG